jgi:hypothetical protein
MKQVISVNKVVYRNNFVISMAARTESIQLFSDNVVRMTCIEVSVSGIKS